MGRPDFMLISHGMTHLACGTRLPVMRRCDKIDPVIYAILVHKPEFMCTMKLCNFLNLLGGKPVLGEY